LIVARPTAAATLAGARRAAFLLGILLLLGTTPAAAETALLEQAVKATYLYKFAPFIEWPRAAFPTSSTPLNICVMRADAFHTILEQAATGQGLGQRPIAVHRLEAIARDSGCHIVYLGGADAPFVIETLALMRGSPVLTVTEGAREPAAKGIINFVIDKARVRFEIDDQAAAENGLVISSKLLSLAIAVRRRA
jgi:hypothetical protein